MRHRSVFAIVAIQMLPTGAAYAGAGPTTAEKIDATLSFLFETSCDAVNAGLRVAPALMLGICMVVVVPVLVAFSRVARWGMQSPMTTRRYRGGTLSHNVAGGLRDPIDQLPGRASLEVLGIGSPGAQYAILRDMLRIGREEDNDIRIPFKTVHRYHAAIHREDVGAYRITDLSGIEGNGIVVNGQRCSDAALADGDLIELGPGRLRFHAGLV